MTITYDPWTERRNALKLQEAARLLGIEAEMVEKRFTRTPSIREEVASLLLRGLAEVSTDSAVRPTPSL